MDKIIISDLEKFNNIKDSFIKDGIDRIHIIADFDGTLTKTNINKDGKDPSIISLLRSEKYNYLGDDYSNKAKILFEEYHPIEIDSSLDLSFRKNKMSEWWKKHLELLIESKLKFEHIEKVALCGAIQLKDGCRDLFIFSKENNIPIVIMSANGIGDTMSIYLNHNDCLFDNVYFITNHFEFDNNGFAINYSLPIIHSLNKDETTVKDFNNIYENVREKRNVILIGDGMGDTKMAEGFDYNNLLKIGFLHEKQEENLEYYKNNYDVVLLEDNSIEFVNDFLKEISK